jgi:hypothetical protein
LLSFSLLVAVAVGAGVSVVALELEGICLLLPHIFRLARLLLGWVPVGLLGHQ